MNTACVAAEVVDRARSGDGEAIAELVQTHQAEICSFLYRMTAHRQDAEDVRRHHPRAAHGQDPQ